MTRSAKYINFLNVKNTITKRTNVETIKDGFIARKTIIQSIARTNKFVICKYVNRVKTNINFLILNGINNRSRRKELRELKNTNSNIMLFANKK